MVTPALQEKIPGSIPGHGGTAKLTDEISDEHDEICKYLPDII